ncbi:MAG: tubulin-like doman-containing protein [Gemmataceae bacterium]
MSVQFQSQAEPIAGYRLLDRLGSGGFGEVWRAEAPGGIFKAIKLIHGDLRHRETDAYRFAEQELKSLNRVKQVRHPYLLALDRIDVVDGRLLIVMELADCNLWDRFRQCRKAGLPGIPRDELLRYMAETAEVLDLMNDRFQLQHLDIKPQNLFLLHQHVKVADFGQVKDLEGMVASVTGGITPVYAAPETFDGFVSRFCDQYSLACVYQELLTGTRPFDGGSMQQLLMQHLQMPPNLAPSPPSDRPALARALSKKAEHRFPTVSQMVAALRAGGESAARTVVPAEPPPVADLRPATDPAAVAELIDLLDGADSTPAPRSAVDTQPPFPDRLAPPERTGPGPVRPALVLAVGYAGLRVAQRLRRQLADRFGPPARTPAVRLLYLDTAPDAADLAAAAADDAAPLGPDEVVAAPLNRAAHYHKLQLSGRSIMDKWFDPQLLCKLPRVPLTLGLRAFGRLALCDHIRAVQQKLAAELDACLDPHALADTVRATGLELGSNRPRVYVVAGLGGGTGSGMFLDLAYLARRRLKQIGYADPDVVGVLLAPPDGPPGAVHAQAQANTYAALTELHHYTRPETVFDGFDDRGGPARDADPPFRAVYLLPGPAHPTPPAAGSGAVPPAGSRPVRGSGAFAPRRGDSRPAPAAHDPTAAVADLIRFDLAAPVGPAAAEARPLPPAAPVTVRTAGVCRFTWPRGEVVRRAARVTAPVLLHHWTHPDPELVREVIPRWAVEQWNRLGLDPERLLARFGAAAAEAAGGPVADVAAAVTGPLVPRGWRARVPDPAAVSLAADRLIALLGRPQAMANRQVSRVEEGLAAAADRVAAEVAADLAAGVHRLVESPTYRVAGAEEAARQLLALFDRARDWCKGTARAAQERSAAALDQIYALPHTARTAGRHAPAEFAAALTAFPDAQFRYLMGLAAGRLYTVVRDGWPAGWPS